MIFTQSDYLIDYRCRYDCFSQRMISLKRRTRFVLKTLISVAVAAMYRFTKYRPEPEEKPATVEPPMDPKKPALPISYALKTLEELENRSYFDSFHYFFNKCSVPLPPSRASKAQANRPRLLVCHDMQGGYLDDKWVQGDNNSGAYAIWHWYLIDIFVYFSHTLVTLPPPCWTNTAHRHGVRVLGTFILEGDDGQTIAKTLLSSKESAQMYADRLTELAIALGFDGWLINMEIMLELEQITELKQFLDHLTLSIHAALPGSLVIWYDSVTKDGNLLWQNQLNENNKLFFDICDGIFTNYSWQESYPKLSASVASKRQFDVYMGIDVFGRGTYGGGQWTVNVALDVAKKAGVSVALFAPGWVYESKQGPSFEVAQNRWWGLVEKSWHSAQTYPELLPFFSNFDRGYGKGIYVEEQQISNQPWSNISCQSFQPLLEVATDSPQIQFQPFINFEENAYSGGACITLKGDLEDNTHVMTKLFHGNMPLQNSPLCIAYSTKSKGDSRFCLALQLSDGLNTGILMFLAPEGTAVSNTSIHGQSRFFLQLPDNNYKTSATKLSGLKVHDSTSQLQISNDWVLREYTLEMDGYTLTEIYAVSYKGRLDGTKALEIVKRPEKLIPMSSTVHKSEPPEKQNIISDGLGSSFSLENSQEASYNASLGHITLTSCDNYQGFPPSDSWIFTGNDIAWGSTTTGQRLLSINLTWKLKMGSDFSRGEAGPAFLRYDLYVEKIHKVQDCGLVGIDHLMDSELQHLGVAVVQAFYIFQLPVSPEYRSLKFFLQVCIPSGDFQSLKYAPSLAIDVPSVV